MWRTKSRSRVLDEVFRDAGFTNGSLSTLMSPVDHTQGLSSFWLCNTRSDRSKNRCSGDASANRFHSLIFFICLFNQCLTFMGKKGKFTGCAYTRWTWFYHSRYSRWKQGAWPSENPQDDCERRKACLAITMLSPCLQSFSQFEDFILEDTIEMLMQTLEVSFTFHALALSQS